MDGMETPFLASGTAAIVVTAILQSLKGADWATWFRDDTGRANRIASIVAATLTSLGLVFTFEFDANTGAFVAGLTGNAWSIAGALGQGAIQWAQQHVLYHGAVKPGMVLTRILCELQKANGTLPKDADPIKIYGD